MTGTPASPPNAGAPLEGFDVAVHAALGSPILLGGVPRIIAIVNGTLAADDQHIGGQGDRIGAAHSAAMATGAAA